MKGFFFLSSSLMYVCILSLLCPSAWCTYVRTQPGEMFPDIMIPSTDYIARYLQSVQYSHQILYRRRVFRDCIIVMYVPINGYLTANIINLTYAQQSGFAFFNLLVQIPTTYSSGTWVLIPPTTTTTYYIHVYLY
ncbi:hypothetical protein GGS21DRAFT_515555, partial [Xylaria nigripes]